MHVGTNFFFGAEKSSKVGILHCLWDARKASECIWDVCIHSPYRERDFSNNWCIGLMCIDAVACISLQHVCLCVDQNIDENIYIKGQMHLDEWCTSLFCSSILSIANMYTFYIVCVYMCVWEYYVLCGAHRFFSRDEFWLK